MYALKANINKLKQAHQHSDKALIKFRNKFSISRNKIPNRHNISKTTFHFKLYHYS